MTVNEQLRPETGDADFLLNPAGVLGALRETHGPVVAGVGEKFGEVQLPVMFAAPRDRESYLILSYAGVLEALRHPSVSHDVFAHTSERVMGRALIGQDAPVHTILRRLLMSGFTPTQVDWWEKRGIIPALTSTLDSLVGVERFDLVHDLAAVYPYLVITNILGLPDDEREWATKMVLSMIAIASRPIEAFDASHRLADYFRMHIARKRAEPKEDFISTLVNAELEDGRKLTDDELVNFLRHLLLAGIETTYSTTGCLMHHLLALPERWEKLKSDPQKYIPAAIEETLRTEPAGAYFPRITREEITIEGVTIPADTWLFVSLVTANREPTRWERPDEFDLDRPSRSHLAFAAGPHTCIGMHLARRELTLFLRMLIERFPVLALDPDTELVPITGIVGRHPDSLKVVKPVGIGHGSMAPGRRHRAN
ncbi:cytochrome P450 [Mycobacterium vicinigordonae]|uniref:Cytochrome P450 n=1 Tax=Mycobacterium vicinigordonae TaxID=1719132 RepID=A0A7D6IAF2_9MYCO|nr:cytochrome P450 [Mycobacterium vicinigordonae]QLL08717.1 cytochrome P450 [Mycobacterium vicinigordonae]